VGKALLKIISIILGYSLWAIASADQIISLWIEVPLSFYNVDEHLTIDAPEKIMINIEGKRIDLSSLESSKLAVHCDVQSFNEGEHYISVTNRNLFLPYAIKLVHYKPSNLVITALKQVN